MFLMTETEKNMLPKLHLKIFLNNLQFKVFYYLKKAREGLCI